MTELFFRGDPDEEIRVGVSSCLLGEEVRFDGGHKCDSFLTGALAPFVRFVPVCPEVGIGLGTPRETLHLIRRDGATRLVTTKTRVDHTAAMEAYAHRKATELEAMDLCAYVLKRASPSCGMERVREYDANGVPTRTGVGIFARILMERMPLLPVEEEGRLNDAALRENFVERIFAYRGLKAVFREGWTAGDLVRFHSGEKLLLLAHDPESYRALGRLVADAGRAERDSLHEQYRNLFMAAFGKLATTGRHVNVLQHMFGYFRDALSDAERRSVLGTIDDYQRGLVPLVVPVTLIRHYVRLHAVEYLEGQRYLEPHPKELMLRNHV